MIAATNDPGTVQIHIQRSLDKAAAAKAAESHKHDDPIVYGVYYHEGLLNALRNMWVG